MSSGLGALALFAAIVAAVLARGGGVSVGVPRPAHPDRDALELAGWRLGLARWEGVRVVAVGIGLVMASAVGLFAPLGAIAGLGPSLLVRIRAQAARDRARRELPRFLLTTHGILRSGVALPQALRRAVESCDDPLTRRPFEQALARFDVGDSLDVTLRAAARQQSDRRMVAALETLALGIAERLPIDRAASLIGSIADRATHEERLDTEVRARAAGVRLQTNLLAAIVPALALYLIATMPGLAATLGSGIGRTLLVPLAAALEIAGIVIGAQIVRGVTR